MQLSNFQLTYKAAGLIFFFPLNKTCTWLYHSNKWGQRSMFNYKYWNYPEQKTQEVWNRWLRNCIHTEKETWTLLIHGFHAIRAASTPVEINLFSFSRNFLRLHNTSQTLESIKRQKKKKIHQYSIKVIQLFGLQLHI